MESKQAVLVKRESVPSSSALKNVVPEHLRPPPSRYQRFLRFTRSIEAPLLPMSIAVIAGHVYFVNYLYSDEFKQDFAGADRIPVFQEIEDIKNYVKNGFRTLKNIVTFQGSEEDRKNAPADMT